MRGEKKKISEIKKKHVKSYNKRSKQKQNMQQQKKEQVKNIEDVRTQKVKWIHHRRAIPRRGWQVKNKKKPSALSMWGFFCI